MHPASVLIIGVNGPLGFGLARQFAEKEYEVFTTVIAHPGSNILVNALLGIDVKTLELESLEEESFVAAASKFGADQTLDILINCPETDEGEEFMSRTTGEQMMYKYQVMNVVPFLAWKHFLPNLSKGGLSKVVAMSQQWMYPINPASGAHISHRTAMMAVNHLTETISQEFMVAGLNIAAFVIDPEDAIRETAQTQYLQDCLDDMYQLITEATIHDNGMSIDLSGDRQEI